MKCQPFANVKRTLYIGEKYSSSSTSSKILEEHHLFRHYFLDVTSDQKDQMNLAYSGIANGRKREVEKVRASFVQRPVPLPTRLISFFFFVEQNVTKDLCVSSRLWKMLTLSIIHSYEKMKSGV
ncbi:hypothetical protein RUM43_002065 [Polyplax serrata]|uniref:Uncharacterized protein n=1 Tax=Polyplax serrata TaxID=468196 RepID=A0AAN8RVN6_POLSC